MRERTRILRTTAVCATVLLAGLGLTGCGDDSAVQPEPTTGQEPSASSGSQATDDAGDDAGSAPAGLTGEPLPGDWPAEFLVPDGEVILVLSIGASGYSVTVEGVDDAQARGLIDEMVAAGLTTTAGVTETGVGEEWVAEVIGSSQRASYAYAGGGAGEPNITIQLVPNG